MSEAHFTSRLDVLRRAFTDGPIAELRDLQREAGVSGPVLTPGYQGAIKEDLRRRIAHAAAKLLKLNAQEVEAWLCGVQDAAGRKTWPDVPCIDEYVRWLPTQVACTLCKGLFDRGSSLYVPAKRRCSPCIRSLNPGTALYEEALAANLPQIKAVNPLLGSAVERALKERVAPTNTRLAAYSKLPLAMVSNLLKGMGLDKRAMNPNVRNALLWLLLAGGACGIAQKSDFALSENSPSRTVRKRTARGKNPKDEGEDDLDGPRAEAA